MGEHDNLFKHVFRVPAHAAGELRSLLPPAAESALDLDRLVGSPGTELEFAL